MQDIERLKQKAALCALDLVGADMRLGLGTGSTARYFVDALAERVADGLSVLCVPTSESTRAQAERLNIPLTTLDAVKRLDLTIDGADEIDTSFRLIKGAGAALLREKIVAQASDKMVVIADARKYVKTLGAFRLPVEVSSFAHTVTAQAIEQAITATGHAGALYLRAGVTTDGGNYIYDCQLDVIANPEKLAQALIEIVGVIEHGLFLDICDGAIIATETDIIEIGNL